jgi:hypothetical protein
MLHAIRCLLATAIIAAIAPFVSAQEPDAEKKSVDKAIKFLKKQQKADGTWPHPQKTGMTALAALAMLEAGVSADDDAITKAAKHVRLQASEMTHTYTISLSVLLLRRLNYLEDLPLVESLGIRLLAGQNTVGGWGYHCPRPHEKEIERINQIVKSMTEEGAEFTSVTSKQSALSHEAKQLLDKIKRDPTEVPSLGDTSNTVFATLALAQAREIGFPIEEKMADVDRRFALSMKPGGWNYSPQSASLDITAVPILQMPQTNVQAGSPFSKLGNAKQDVIRIVIAKGKGVLASCDPPPYRALLKQYENSGVSLTTHFTNTIGVNQNDRAALANAEWIIVANYRAGQPAASRRPASIKPGTAVFGLSVKEVEQTMVESQMDTGKELPSVRPLGTTPAMTADALVALGLAISANPTPPPFAGLASGPMQQLRLQCASYGLQALSPAVGAPVKDAKKVTKFAPRDNACYFLWSLNQAAQLYGTKDFAGKDWQAWGSQMLIANQKDDGSWPGAFGHADTAFGLMFLSRSNLTPTATARLQAILENPANPPTTLPGDARKE